MSESDTREERIYDQIRRMVLWGEKEEAVFQKLEVNGFTGEKAGQLYARARAERVWAIRGDCLRSLGWGVLWFAAGAGVFSVFWFGFGAITRVLMMLTGAAMLVGVWKIAEAVIGFFTASHKTGSLADGD